MKLYFDVNLIVVILFLFLHKAINIIKQLIFT